MGIREVSISASLNPSLNSQSNWILPYFGPPTVQLEQTFLGKPVEAVMVLFRIHITTVNQIHRPALELLPSNVLNV